MKTKMAEPKRVVVFRSHLLPFSNTFVYNQVKFLKTFKAVLSGTKLVHQMDLQSFKTIVPEGIHLRTLFALIGYSPKFYQQISDFNPGLVHAHFGTDSIHALKIKKKLNLPLITTFHGYDICVRKPEHYTHKLMWKQFDHLIGENSKVIAVSDFIVDKLLENGVDPHKIVKHNIGIDLRPFEEPAKKEKFILFVGRLVEKKGCKYLIDAFAKFSSKFPEHKLVIIGDGPLRKKLETYAVGLKNKVQFLGSLPHNEVVMWMKKAEIFCAPSIVAENGDAEALGLVFAEAQAAGAPVVSFDSGGISEVVLQEKTGFLAAEKAVDQLAEYLSTLAGDERLRQSFVLHGKKNVAENHNISIQTEKLERIYESVIS